MASTVSTMAMLNAKCLSINSSNKVIPSSSSKPSIKPISLLSLQNLSLKKSPESLNLSSSLTGTAIAGAIFSTLSSCDAAFAAQQIADIAEGDNRGLALLLPLVPAILWVLYNILQPAINQVNKMRNKSIIVGLGLTGLAASGFVSTPDASAANEMGMIAEAAASDNRGTLLLFVLAPAIGWVLFNILQPALNQINKMRS